MANNFGLFFTRDDTVIRLPVNPEKLPVAKTNDNSEYNVLGIGPVMVPRTPKLRQVTISSYFPGRTFPGVLTSGGFLGPEFYLNFFQSAMDDKAPILYTPVRYYENGEPFLAGDLGFQVLVTEFSTQEKGGETGDFYYDLELTEYRDYSPSIVDIPPLEGASAGSVSPSRAVPQNQLVVGSVCNASGKYFASSYGDPPSGNGNGRRCVVSRIISDPSRPYPIHITTESGGWLGWLTADQLQVVD